jgi:hypothetical protein
VPENITAQMVMTGRENVHSRRATPWRDSREPALSLPKGGCRHMRFGSAEDGFLRNNECTSSA